MSEPIKMRGRLVLFDMVDNIGIKIPKDCKITYPEILPLIYNFEFNKVGSVLGNVKVTKDEKGLICDAIIMNRIDRDMLRDTFQNELPIGGYYRNIKNHMVNGVRVFDEMNLVAVSVTLGSASDKYKLVLVEEEEKENA